MKTIEKSNTKFREFDWLDFDNPSNKNGHKFELYLPEEVEVNVKNFISIFYLLFSSLLREIEIAMIEPNVGSGGWGDFCIDTWNIHDDTYDYSPKNKRKETGRYLQMLQKNEIEPSYNGFCRCNNWDEFLSIILIVLIYVSDELIENMEFL